MLVATGILLGSAVVLFELAAIGRAHIESTEDLSTAQQICETRINEMLAGLAPIRIVESEPFEDDPDWTISVQLDAVEHLSGLAALRVTAAREASPGHRAKRYTLVRWIRDPQAAQDSSSLMPASSEGSPGAETPP
jgi:hypothetical protein